MFSRTPSRIYPRGPAQFSPRQICRYQPELITIDKLRLSSFAHVSVVNMLALGYLPA